MTNPPGPVLPSRSQVKKAASALRAYFRNETGQDQYMAALQVVADYRKLFSLPLTKVNNGLRSFVKRKALEGAVVTQRLKREETIVEKLTVRETTMSLATMQDIGGCRVVLKDLQDLRVLEGEITRVWGRRVVNHVDYIKEPRASGYRAVHIVVERDSYPIEIQLRTEEHHAWAQTVESFSGAGGSNYKQDGDSPVQGLMAVISEVEQILERDEVPPSSLMHDMRMLAELAKEHLLRDERREPHE